MNSAESQVANNDGNPEENGSRWERVIVKNDNGTMVTASYGQGNTTASYSVAIQSSLFLIIDEEWKNTLLNISPFIRPILQLHNCTGDQENTLSAIALLLFFNTISGFQKPV